jgi:hypothetical protein
MDIAGKLRPEDLFASIESAQRSMSVINRLVMRFKPEDRAEMRTALVQDLSRTLSMDWLKSVRNIEGFKIDGKEYRLMNDDSVEAVVTDPRGVARAV